MKNAEWMIQKDMEFSKLSWAYVTGKNTVKNTVYYDKGGYLKKFIQRSQHVLKISLQSGLIWSTNRFLMRLKRSTCQQ